jgi:hypothetical protein
MYTLPSKRRRLRTTLVVPPARQADPCGSVCRLNVGQENGCLSPTHMQTAAKRI